MSLASMIEHGPVRGAEALFVERICSLVATRCGFSPRPAARTSLRSTLARRLDGRSHEAYWQALHDERTGAAELQGLVEDLLNHETVCGRNPPHFDALAERVLLPLSRLGRPIRLASLGCSTGEEAYSLAITAAQYFGTRDEPAVEIVGLDLSGRVLQTARAGIYRQASLRELTSVQREVGFVSHPDGFQVRPAIARRVRFLQHNLLQPLPLLGLDAVFCRNVLIYFNTASAHRVLANIRAALAPGGWLFLGPSESALHHREWFEPVPCAETMLYRRRSS
ncbi:MAG: protein-glutamate O-methyltransferase CheR [Opitutaceae bacterium]